MLPNIYILLFSCCFTSSIVVGQQREEGEWPVVRCQTEKGGGVVVDWVPNRERRPAGRVSFAQTPAGVAGRVKLVLLLYSQHNVNGSGDEVSAGS